MRSAGERNARNRLTRRWAENYGGVRPQALATPSTHGTRRARTGAVTVKNLTPGRTISIIRPVASSNYFGAVEDEGEFKNRRKSGSRRGYEAEVFFVRKSASLPRRLPFLNAPWVEDGSQFNETGMLATFGQIDQKTSGTQPFDGFGHREMTLDAGFGGAQTRFVQARIPASQPLCPPDESGPMKRIHPVY